MTKKHTTTINFVLLLVIFLLLFACSSKNAPLPILGKRTILGQDTIYHTIPSFQFINQDSQLVTEQTFRDKIYVVDFFFTSCPTICPTMTQQLLRIHDHFKAEDKLLLLSHSIDTKYDTVGTLKRYAEQLGVSSQKWHFVTGEKKELFEVATDYFNVIIEDETLPGGYDHTGRFVLVDEQRRIRSYCNGIRAEEVDRFIGDIEKLIDEN